ncbi:Mov34/MPN/PAD-1 family protein [Stutzerimonas stutzeri]|uniref:Mov34/MPN/PAD-1 family protein n=1 Tax=Stutzerimonas stutzeri TaxID=316 RepID=UPI003C2D461D
MSILWIEERAVDGINAEACRAYPQETGGILVGYIADGELPVVVTVVGPGPDAVHQRDRFQPDHAWQCERLDELYDRSAGVLVYLGDWHTHPDGSPQMSWLDRKTIRAIARHAPAQCAQPLMLIGGGSPGGWQWVGHRFRSERLLGMLIFCEVLEVRRFRPPEEMLFEYETDYEGWPRRSEG